MLDKQIIPKYEVVDKNPNPLVPFGQPVTKPREEVHKMPLCLKYQCSSEIRKKIRIAKYDINKKKLLDAEADLSGSWSDDNYQPSLVKLPPFRKISDDKRYRNQMRGIKF